MLDSTVEDLFGLLIVMISIIIIKKEFIFHAIEPSVRIFFRTVTEVYLPLVVVIYYKHTSTNLI